MLRKFLVIGVILAVAGCAPTPMRWEKPGGGAAGPDEADCRAQAHQAAIDQLPYGDGPPIYGLHSDWSMLTWKQAIDNDRYYLERDLVRVCMHNKGYDLVPATPK
jgi:hypothetical protein